MKVSQAKQMSRNGREALQDPYKYMESHAELTDQQAEAFLDDWNENNRQLKRQGSFHIKVILKGSK